MSKPATALLLPLLALTSAGMAGERLPEAAPHQAPVTTETLPGNLQAMDEQALSETRGIVNAPQALAPPTAGESFDRGDELLRHEQADRAALIVEIDSNLEETARALQGASAANRPELEQRFQNLSTLRRGL